jgi:single-strand DNA-binding protein
MNSLNSILMEGNLTKDPELKTTSKGTSVCAFTVASNRYYKQEDEQKQEVSFFPVEVWAGLADTCNQYLKKGRGVRVVGRLKQDRWKDQDEKNHERFKIVAEHVEFKPLFSKNGKEKKEVGVPHVDNPSDEQISEDDLLKAI